MTSKGSTSFSQPRHDVDDSRRQSGIQAELTQTQCRSRRLFGRLEHNGVAASQRRTELRNCEDQREIPGEDSCDDPNWLADDVDMLVNPTRNLAAAYLVAEPRVKRRQSAAGGTSCSRACL